MYFMVGGRRTQSALYRVKYTGSESTDPAQAPPVSPEAKLRKEGIELPQSTLAELKAGAEGLGLALPSHL